MIKALHSVKAKLPDITSNLSNYSTGEVMTVLLVNKLNKMKTLLMA